MKRLTEGRLRNMEFLSSFCDTLLLYYFYKILKLKQFHKSILSFKFEYDEFPYKTITQKL